MTGDTRAGCAQVWCQGIVWCTQCLKAEVVWGRIELVSMGKSRTGVVCKRASMQEKKRECLGLGLMRVNGDLGV